MMAITIFMPRAPDSDKHKSTSVNSKGILLHHSMENWILLMYKTASVLRRARGIKNGAGPVKGPRRPDIAPTGELAGLPARDAPKSSRVTASLESGPGLQKSSKKKVSYSAARYQIASGPV